MEEYRKYNDSLEVSNYGNVRISGATAEIHEGNPYNYICFGGKQERVHVLVGELFPDICGEKIKWGHLHHINRDKKDNRAENLIWLSRSEHIRMHQQEKGVSVGVKAYDLDGNYVGRWDSKTQAAMATGTDYRHLTDTILKKSGRFTAGNYYWFQDDISDDDAHKKILEIQSTKYQALKGNNHRSHKKNLAKS